MSDAVFKTIESVTSADNLMMTSLDYVNMTTGGEGAEEAISPFKFVLDKFITPFMFGMISLIGFVGNSLVIFVILSNSKMRTVTNILLLNLAISDLCFVLVVPPFTAYQQATSQWPFGEISCKLMHYLVDVSAYVTVYTLVLISVTRYMTVVHNVKTVHIRTRRNIVIMVVATWLIMMLVNIPILQSYGAKPGKTDDCDIYDEKTGKPIFTTLFVFAYLLPLTVIAILSILIVRHIAAQRAACTMLRTEGNRGAAGATNGGAGKGASSGGGKGGRKRHASRLLVLVVVLFALLWLPVHVYLLLAFYVELPNSDLSIAAMMLAQCLAYFNSCVNPIIYNRTSKDFRDAFRAAVRCHVGEAAGGGAVEDKRGNKPRTNTGSLSYSNATKNTTLSAKQDVSARLPLIVKETNISAAGTIAASSPPPAATSAVASYSTAVNNTAADEQLINVHVDQRDRSDVIAT